MEPIKLWDANYYCIYEDGILTVKDQHDKVIIAKSMPKQRLKAQYKLAAEEMLSQKYGTKKYYSPAEIADEVGMFRQAMTKIIPKMARGLHYIKAEASSSILITEYGREVLIKRYSKVKD